MKRTYASLLLTSLSLNIPLALAETTTLQDVVQATNPLPEATLYTAREVVTLDPNRPKATAVAVLGERILATGTLEELKAAAGKQPYHVDNSFADQVLVPGFIAQHDHPLLTALTMTAEIIAIEDWVLPQGTSPAAKDAKDYRARLTAANARLQNPGEPLVSWGYHHLFHGSLSRTDLDQISSTRPIIVLHRSWHEVFLNSKALALLGIDQKVVDALPEAARKQADLQAGHFWEGGLFGIASRLVPLIATPERFKQGLELTEQYLHTNGVTVGAEPGGLYSQKLQAAQNAVLSDTDTPFRFYFIPDGKSIFALFPETAVTETEKTLSWGQGMTQILPKQIKLFADGAIYSQLMQTREPYLDGHHGEWIMPPSDFARAFRIYWDAGYQIHIHVNGDAGVDMVLDNVEANMRRNPRYNHRTTLVHLAVSQSDQIERMKRLGVLVSANPYYVTMLADKYSEQGLGPDRANNLVRIGEVERAGISFSFHSDMPMAPAQPLFLMHAAVNRTTVSGRVAGKDQRSSREGALRAVTLDAAYSLQLENQIGSISPGKLANFTVLSDNPVTIDAAKIKDIRVWGTVHEGRKLPVASNSSAKAALGPIPNHATFQAVQLEQEAHAHEQDGHADICQLNKLFTAAMMQEPR